MNEPTGPIEFLVQGSASSPYLVTFWREQQDLRSSCTCQAGTRGLACKHRLSLLEGDVTALVSKNIGDLGVLRELCKGTDVESAVAASEATYSTPDFGDLILPLKPPGRRKSMSPDIAGAILLEGGLVKGNTSYFDVYDCGLAYIGSVKVRRGTVFSEEPRDYFPTVQVVRKRITDGLVWERSQSVYLAYINSKIANYLSGDTEQANSVRRLKRAISDY